MFTSFVVGLGLALQRRTNQAHFFLHLYIIQWMTRQKSDTFNSRHHIILPERYNTFILTVFMDATPFIFKRQDFNEYCIFSVTWKKRL